MSALPYNQAAPASQATPWRVQRPRIAAILDGVGSLVRYIVSFQWIVDIVRWMIGTGGNVAESAFLLATVYVTINVVAHKLVTWTLPPNIISTLNQVSVIAFSVLPELIVAAAIKVTFDHYKMAWTTKRWDSWVWAALYTLPTSVFLYMTIITISSFVSLEAVNVDYQAHGTDLVIRCLAGWSYGMLQTLFVALGKQGYASLIARLRSDLAALGDTLRARDNELATMTANMADLQAQLAAQQKELVNARIALANKKNARPAASGDTDELTATSAPGAQNSTSEDSISEDEDNAPVTSEKYQRVKEHLKAAILAGGKVNFKQVAAAAGVSYGMIRKRKNDLLKDIEEEINQARNTETLEAVGASA